LTDRALVDPLHVFRFLVKFSQRSLARGGDVEPVELGEGAFAECTGLEATMEPRVIKEGGRNHGAAQRAGPVTFGTVVLKRGVTRGQDLWAAFIAVASGAYSVRLDVEVTLCGPDGQRLVRYDLALALPVKFKAADFNARSTEVGVEELHLAHEGLAITRI